MADERQELLSAIERDREEILDFYRGFIRARSPNPPGDTTEAAAHIRKFLSGKGLEHRAVAPMAQMPNIVASFDGGAAGRHLVLNGHIDVFPVEEGAPGWTQDPWGGALVDGKIYGRGACDMKAGTSSSIFTYYYLHGIRRKLKGKLTLTCVSDEETFGPWGARYLIEHHPEVRGDCLLNGEPSGLNTIRFGEKGPLWLAFTIRTPGAHGAYTHLSPSATKIAGRLVADLEAVTKIPAKAPDNVVRALDQAAPAVDKAMGQGASQIVQQVTLNIGVVKGGLKVNMVPGECRIEADIRLPLGVDDKTVMAEVRKIVARYPEVAVEQINYSPPSWCDPYGEMVDIIRANVTSMSKIEPVPIVSLGGTDARLWRYHNVPAYVYGPPPTGMGSYDEHVKVEDFFHVLRTHVLSAYDYLSRG
ncbi:MAG TPA: M20/M25/M40 family metallo-hydrolase [Alphaproteobacteria bacterium]|nr:M20/M25/M40 family metallo-hydrolase [Alphaproteobacteria bacterium]